MSPLRLYSIIALMSLALLGIVVIQVSLLRRSLAANEANFAAGVNDALHEVASQLEAKKMRTQILRIQEGVGVFREERSMTLSRNNLSGGSREMTSEIHAIEIHDSMGATERVELNELGESQGAVVWMSGQASDKNVRIELKGDPGYVELLQTTLEGLEAMELDYAANLDSTELDQLLRENLDNQGIHLGYEYAIESRPKAEQASRPVPEESFHRVALFPNTHNGNRVMLSLAFPGQSSFLLGSIWREAVGSLLFSGIILLCFGLTVSTIFRQKRLSEMKNDFINNMTHELKTPIATIGLAADTLVQQRKVANAEFIDRYASIIKEENSRMNRQVERVLQAAQFDRSHVSLTLEDVNVHELLRQSISHMGLQVTQRGGQIRQAFHARQDVVRADREHLSHVFSNLLDNANKYSPEAPDILVSTENRNGELLITVTDKGCGIPKSMQEDIFTRFYRASTGNLHDVKGFGLGLSYVKEIVEAHGGSVSVASKPGAGSTFTVSLGGVLGEEGIR